nr:MAG TPA: hypothetical protein [Bacteriophage sp.]
MPLITFLKNKINWGICEKSVLREIIHFQNLKQFLLLLYWFIVSIKS